MEKDLSGFLLNGVCSKRMKIVFWAPVHGQTRQSSNLLALALYMALEQRRRLLITQTQFRMNDLEDAIVGRAGAKEIRERFYQNMGIDSLIRCIKRKMPQKDDVENCCVQVLSNAELMLLPGSQVGNYEVYYKTFCETIVPVFRETEKYFDAVLIDTNPGMNQINHQLLEEADLVVVNLSQNIGVLDLYFNNIPKELERKKVFYMLGSYLADSCYNLENLRLRYRRLKKNNSGVIPVNVGFMDAISGGRMQDYFETNLECVRGDTNYIFMREVIRAVERLSYLMDEIQTTKVRSDEKRGVNRSEWERG